MYTSYKASMGLQQQIEDLPSMQQHPKHSVSSSSEYCCHYQLLLPGGSKPQNDTVPLCY